VPTYLFVGTLLWVIIEGTIKTVLAGGHPTPVVAPPAPGSTVVAAASAWILLQVFSNGCTAMTGVEAVSNGVRAFREPAVKEAQRALTVIIGLLIVLLAGIAYLIRAYGIAATDPGAPGYQSVLSMLVSAVSGRGWFYYVTIGSVLLILSLSANTAFADFPRLCRVVAQNSFLPHSLGYRGRRLVYSEGILLLAALSAALLILFGGVTDRLIPLFAIGAFTAFTLSQAGMVAHWRRLGGPGSGQSMLINGLGAVATGITTLVVLVAKFASGAWVSALLIAVMIGVMLWVRNHYRRVAQEVTSTAPLDVGAMSPPLVVVAIQHWGKIAQRALQFALALSPDIYALHVAMEDEAESLRQQWREDVEIPVKNAGHKPPELIILPSPYRLVLRPILQYVLQAEKENPERQIAIIVPELVERHWYHYPLHNQRAEMLKAMILLHGSDRIVLINVPWYLRT
jgi:hypothetical protein